MGVTASWKPICPGSGYPSASATPGNSAASPKLSGNKPSPKRSMRWAADLANLIFRLSGRGHYGASVISPALFISAWGRRLKTTNAQSAQLAALRHKRALILWLEDAFARRGGDSLSLGRPIACLSAPNRGAYGVQDRSYPRTHGRPAGAAISCEQAKSVAGSCAVLCVRQGRGNRRPMRFMTWRFSRALSPYGRGVE